MNIVGIVLALLAAVIVFVVLTAIISFPHSVLIFGLIAVVIFLVIAFGGVRTRW